jgi:hypothetical protein
MESLLKNVDNF